MRTQRDERDRTACAVSENAIMHANCGFCMLESCVLQVRLIVSVLIVLAAASTSGAMFAPWRVACRMNE